MPFLANTSTWYIQIQPYPNESLSHYLGRFCRANHISTAILANEARVGHALLGRIQKFRFNPIPTAQQLERIGSAMGLNLAQVQAMMPTQPMQLEPIRLCAACYTETPYHQMHWQYKDTAGCLLHGLRLLPRCPRCGEGFNTPNTWRMAACQRCGLPFAEMAHLQM